MTDASSLRSGGFVESPRDRILHILRTRDGVGVEEFARELELSGATVRRHLDVLRRDGSVSVAQVRGGTGRPRYAFSLTEAGAELFPHHYVRLTHRLITEILSLEAGETVGQDGAALAALVFDRMAQRLARECAPRVHGDSLVQRAHQAVQLLGEEGLDFEVAVEGDALRLLGRGCPCVRLGAQFDAPVAGAGTCDHDRVLLEQMLGARVVPLAPHELPHDFLSGYRVEEAPREA